MNLDPKLPKRSSSSKGSILIPVLLFGVIVALSAVLLIPGRTDIKGGTIVKKMNQIVKGQAVSEEEKPAAPILPKPLADPPKIIKAIYVTNWVAGSPERMTKLIGLVERAGFNAMVIDIKDYSGYVAYKTDSELIRSTGAENELRIKDINSLIEELHSKNIYVIGRISVFQDPVLAKARPELALQNASGKIWKDKMGIMWLDPAGKPTWDYDIALAKDALGRGFDEINFDYIRFPSDGSLDSIHYPFWDKKTARHEVIKNFFKYLRGNLAGAKISADVFGQTTLSPDDMGIGQMIDDAYPYFDYISPMVYPSHYINGFMNFDNPALHPYDVVKYSLEKGFERLNALRTATSTVPTPPTLGKLRPWLQAFDMGATYTKPMIEAQMKATEDVLSAVPGQYAGWLLWDPAVVYRSY